MIQEVIFWRDERNKNFSNQILISLPPRCAPWGPPIFLWNFRYHHLLLCIAFLSTRFQKLSNFLVLGLIFLDSQNFSKTILIFFQIRKNHSLSIQIIRNYHIDYTVDKFSLIFPKHPIFPKACI